MKGLSLITALLLTSIMFAQEFQGVATYKSHRKMDLNMDDKNANSQLHKQLRAQLKKQFQKEYILTFTKEESIYKQDEALSAPSVGSSGIIIKVSNGNDVMYKNIKENRYTNATEIFGKQFLIKDSLQVRKWELVNETKNIGDYTCNMAVFKDTYKTQTLTDDGAIETIEKERETVAWYTMEIPVNIGPSDFYGLPGLILEISDGELTLMCSRLVLNSKNKVEIVEPKKGKVVTQKKFDEIMKIKSDEMQERFKSRSKSGSSQIISFGG